ncbi:omega-amidase, chloroplastic-like isoform X3 [Cornus florida]|uniref:omega-amidase, chloroplastic-like isoform X3 n=1 Tax=Cornus florida TaxID=4283 RepID=UPI00289BE80A|nr:omega-amidase, chloroplastic-like isoform X3 [Cornus florida]
MSTVGPVCCSMLVKMKADIGSLSSSTLDNTANLGVFNSVSQVHKLSSLNSSSFALVSLNNYSKTKKFSKAVHTVVSAARMATSFKPDEARVPPALPLPTPPVTKFKIALCQLSVTTDKERNIIHARKAIEEAAEKGAQLVLLPEIWNSPYSNDSFPVYAEDIDSGGDASPSTAMLSELSRSLQITIVGGSIPERSGDRLYNTCCVFGTDGKLLAKHRKIHLFDIDIPGQMTFKESKTLTAGETPTIVDTGAHLLCYPGAFNMTTGPLHWELLQRARAADCQLYVATCSPARDAGAGYVAWGHSTLVGPYGEVIATTEHDEVIVIAEIDYSLIDLRRTYLPFQKQRRGDLYQLVDVQRLNPRSTK